MGNASGGLPYDISTTIEYVNNNYWLLTEGSKHAEKDDQKEIVSIFRFMKLQHPERVQCAQRSVQKLRTLKHPYVLSFIESADLEDSIALVTESCTPFELWLKNVKAAGINADSKANLIQEIIWGFRCIILALTFLHSNGGLLHGNLGLHAIFVVPGGDWKLGGMELASNMALAEDADYFSRHHTMLGKPFASPERQTLRPGDAAHNESVLKAKVPPFYLDVYSLGQCVQAAFRALDLDTPNTLERYLALMLHSEIRKRPTAQKLSQSAVFNSEHTRLLESISELALKPSKDALAVMGQLEGQIGELSKGMCAHKILPNVCRSLQMAINDFPNRDAREACRQNVQVSVSLLSAMAATNKLDEPIFRRTVVPILVQLWPMTDRAVRTVLLQSLRHLADLIPPAVVNKTVFDNIVAGFADSNAKLRESTLMSLIFIVDKLDDALLQDRLVRCVANLQNDGEASIRTNATIFLGKIAAKLKEPVRVKVLCTCFAKAMKDNFLHCRLAGLKTSTACVKLLDLPQIAAKIMPQASLLLLDKSTEVRAQALLLLEACMALLRANHEAMCRYAKESASGAESPGGPNRHSTAAAGTGGASGAQQAGAADGGWSSWSVLQGLSKTLESAAIASTGSAPPSAGAPAKSSVKPQQSNSANSSSHGATSSMTSANHSSSASLDQQAVSATASGGGQWGGDISFGDEEGDDDEQNQRRQRTPINSSGRKGSGASRAADAPVGWEDPADSIVFDSEEEEGGEGSSSTTTTAGALAPRGMKLTASSSAASFGSPRHSALGSSGEGSLSASAMKSRLGGGSAGSSSALSASGTGSAKAARAPVRKLGGISKDEVNWDDF